jgi:hypothetical protein
MRRMCVCRIARVRGTAWASGYGQNMSPFSSDGRCQLSLLQCLVRLLRRIRSREGAFYLGRVAVLLSDMVSEW